MKTEKEIKIKRDKVHQEYTNTFFSVGNTPETKSLEEQVKLLDWVLDTKFVTIQEDKDDGTTTPTGIYNTCTKEQFISRGGPNF